MCQHHNFSLSKPVGPIPAGFFFMNVRSEDSVNAIRRKRPPPLQRIFPYRQAAVLAKY